MIPEVEYVQQQKGAQQVVSLHLESIIADPRNQQNLQRRHSKKAPVAPVSEDQSTNATTCDSDCVPPLPPAMPPPLPPLSEDPYSIHSESEAAAGSFCASASELYRVESHVSHVSEMSHSGPASSENPVDVRFLTYHDVFRREPIHDEHFYNHHHNFRYNEENRLPETVDVPPCYHDMVRHDYAFAEQGRFFHPDSANPVAYMGDCLAPQREYAGTAMHVPSNTPSVYVDHRVELTHNVSEVVEVPLNPDGESAEQYFHKMMGTDDVDAHIAAEEETAVGTEPAMIETEAIIRDDLYDRLVLEELFGTAETQVGAVSSPQKDFLTTHSPDDNTRESGGCSEHVEAEENPLHFADVRRVSGSRLSVNTDCGKSNVFGVTTPFANPPSTRDTDSTSVSSGSRSCKKFGERFSHLEIDMNLVLSDGEAFEERSRRMSPTPPRVRVARMQVLTVDEVVNSPGSIGIVSADPNSMSKQIGFLPSPLREVNSCDSTPVNEKNTESFLQEDAPKPSDLSLSSKKELDFGLLECGSHVMVTRKGTKTYNHGDAGKYLMQLIGVAPSTSLSSDSMKPNAQYQHNKSDATHSDLQPLFPPIPYAGEGGTAMSTSLVSGSTMNLEEAWTLEDLPRVVTDVVEYAVCTPPGLGGETTTEIHRAAIQSDGFVETYSKTGASDENRQVSDYGNTQIRSPIDNNREARASDQNRQVSDYGNTQISSPVHNNREARASDQNRQVSDYGNTQISSPVHNNRETRASDQNRQVSDYGNTQIPMQSRKPKPIGRVQNIQICMGSDSELRASLENRMHRVQQLPDDACGCCSSEKISSIDLNLQIAMPHSNDGTTMGTGNTKMHVLCDQFGYSTLPKTATTGGISKSQPVAQVLRCGRTAPAAKGFNLKNRSRKLQGAPLCGQKKEVVHHNVESDDIRTIFLHRMLELLSDDDSSAATSVGTTRDVTPEHSSAFHGKTAARDANDVWLEMPDNDFDYVNPINTDNMAKCFRCAAADPTFLYCMETLNGMGYMADVSCHAVSPETARDGGDAFRKLFFDREMSVGDVQNTLAYNLEVVRGLRPDIQNTTVSFQTAMSRYFDETKVEPIVTESVGSTVVTSDDWDGRDNCHPLDGACMSLESLERHPDFWDAPEQYFQRLHNQLWMNEHWKKE